MTAFEKGEAMSIEKRMLRREIWYKYRHHVAEYRYCFAWSSYYLLKSYFSVIGQSLNMYMWLELSFAALDISIEQLVDFRRIQPIHYLPGRWRQLVILDPRR
jgi:hypothetical protein